MSKELKNITIEEQSSQLKTGLYKKYLASIKWQHLVAGLSGGAVATSVLHPLDLVKVRLQVNEGTGTVMARSLDKSVSGTLSEIYKSRGLFGLYQGITPNLIGSTSAWGLYFFIYGAVKGYAQNGDSSKKLSTIEYLSYAYLSGAVVLWLTNPIWVAKTRMCLRYDTLPIPVSGDNSCSANLRLTTWGTLKTIWKHEGIKGLYCGMIPGLIGVSNGAIQFLLYEEMRNFYNERYYHRLIDSHLAAYEYITIASLSKALAVIITYPYQVVRSRLQDQHRRYTGVMHVIQTLLRFEGVRGLYKGLLPNILRTAPACGLTFVVYENTNKWLQ